MLDQFIKSCDTIRRLRSGVLGAHLDSFAEHLASCGYAAATARSQLTLLGHFDQWMARRRRGVGALNDELVDTVHTTQAGGRLGGGLSSNSSRVAWVVSDARVRCQYRVVVWID